MYKKASNISIAGKTEYEIIRHKHYTSLIPTFHTYLLSFVFKEPAQRRDSKKQ